MTDKPWAMARVASRRPLPKPRKMRASVMSTVQVAPPTRADAFEQDIACPGCGYHVCSCPKTARAPAPNTLRTY